MKSAKLGISVGLIGAVIYFSGILSGSLSGYLLTILLVGYVLLCEENLWLKKSALKAISIMITCSVLIAVLNIVPSIFGIVSNVISIFGASVQFTIITGIFGIITGVISLAEKVLLIVLGVKAFNQGTVKIPFIDDFVNKYID